MALALCLPASARPAPSTEAGPTSSSSGAQERRLTQAKAAFDKLSADRKRRRFRDAWLGLVRDLEAAVRLDPAGSSAAEARLFAARAREQLWRVSRVKPDAKAAVDAYRKVDEKSPGSATAAQALVAAAGLSERIGWKAEQASICRRLSARYQSSAQTPSCPRAQPARVVQPAQAVRPVQSQQPGKSIQAAQPQPPTGRPVDPDAEEEETAAPVQPKAAAIEARSATASEAKPATAVKAKPAIGVEAKPAIVVEAKAALAVKATPSGNAKPPAASAKAAARAARDAPATADREADSDTSADQSAALTALVQQAHGLDGRAVAEPDEPAPPAEEAVALHEPDAPEVPAAASAAVAALAAAEQDAEPTPPERTEVARLMRKSVLAKGEVPIAAQLGLQIKRVVIDAGHGGKDTGAIGSHGVREKDVSLAIAKRLEQRLRALGLEVVQTRADDRYVSLDDRTKIANDAKADLFLSIHCNSARRHKASGIETWTLNVASNRYAARLSAFENAGSPLRQSDLRIILADLAKKADTSEARELAQSVQTQLVRTVRSRVGAVRDHGVKQALFYVLLGTQMPSILVETAFLSNPTEEARLKSAKYQEATAEAIARGVKDYLDGRRRIARAGVP